MLQNSFRIQLHINMNLRSKSFLKIFPSFEFAVIILTICGFLFRIIFSMRFRQCNFVSKLMNTQLNRMKERLRLFEKDYKCIQKLLKHITK